MSAGAVTVEEVRRVAELANLQLTAAEEPRMQRDLNAILGHIAQLAELDTTAVEAMAQVGDVTAGLRATRRAGSCGGMWCGRRLSGGR